ncbi:MAG: PepSY-associated TM helix domain-containing protein [Sporomusaceae bacterium]|nr:PepSY-associated TM helix domain-containing protein [Sporomusaceae bacterium]
MAMQTIYYIHRYLSLFCAIFFFLLCLTGLPLLFKEEILEWNQINPLVNSAEADQAVLWDGLGAGIEAIQSRYPHQAIKNVSVKEDQGMLSFRMADSESKGGDEFLYNVRTQDVIARGDHTLKYQFIPQFLHIIDDLHVRLGMGTLGRNFLGFICAVSALSIFTGFRLYGPFWKKTTIVGIRNSYQYWSRLHNLTGVIVGTWGLILSISGIGLVLFSMAYNTYISAAKTEAKQFFSGYEQTHVQQSPMQALAIVRKKFPDYIVVSLRMPETKSAIYSFYIKPVVQTPYRTGQTVFVSAYGTNDLSTPGFYVKPLAWYMAIRAFVLNLHFHNHQSFLLKVIWTGYILLTMFLIVTGLGLALRRQQKKFFAIHPVISVRAGKSRIVPNYFMLSVVFLSVFGFIAPLYGGMDDIAAVALLVPLVLLGTIWYKDR